MLEPGQELVYLQCVDPECPAHRVGIDLDAEFERKIAYNRTRPYQHGGRTLSEVGRAVRRAGEESYA